MSSADLNPTDEQAKAIELFLTGENLVLEAGAGAGKTSTLVMLAQHAAGRSGLYIAFNRSVADEAKRKFRGLRVDCHTAHSLAVRHASAAQRQRLSGPRQNDTTVADLMGLGSRHQWGRHSVARTYFSRACRAAVRNFCASTDDTITAKHVATEYVDARFTGVPLNDAIDEVVRGAQKLWLDIRSDDGRLTVGFDHLLKQWALAKPDLGVDYILFDEAQDADALMVSVVQNQSSLVVAVGDRCQAIYSWRGAVDAMDAFGGNRARLTQSWRFGPAIADEANRWLRAVGSPMMLTGNPSVPSQVRSGRPGRFPKAILCRSNAGMIAEIIRVQDSGRLASTGKNGQTEELIAQIRAMGEIRVQGWTRHPGFFDFHSWDELKAHVDRTPEDQALAPLISLVEEHGHSALIDVLKRTVSARQADVVVCTSHTAKGLEWGSVLIAEDFESVFHGAKCGPPEIAREDAMLAYVAVTRAKRVLDPKGLQRGRTPRLTVKA